MDGAGVGNRRDKGVLGLSSGPVQAIAQDLKKMLNRLAVISLSDEERDRLITPKRLELIRILHGHKGLTVSELAKLLGRWPDTISRDLKVLVKYGIVTLSKEGRRKRVQLVAKVVLLDLKEGGKTRLYALKEG